MPKLKIIETEVVKMDEDKLEVNSEWIARVQRVAVANEIRTAELAALATALNSRNIRLARREASMLRKNAQRLQRVAALATKLAAGADSAARQAEANLKRVIKRAKV